MWSLARNKTGSGVISIRSTSVGVFLDFDASTAHSPRSRRHDNGLEREPQDLTGVVASQEQWGAELAVGRASLPVKQLKTELGSGGHQRPVLLE